MPTWSTPAQKPMPDVLFTVVTVYGADQVVTEHFIDPEARRRSLIERAHQFEAMTGPICDLEAADAERLAGIVSALLTPARVHLTEAKFDADTDTYIPTGRMLPVR